MTLVDVEEQFSSYYDTMVCTVSWRYAIIVDDGGPDWRQDVETTGCCECVDERSVMVAAGHVNLVAIMPTLCRSNST